MELNLQRTLESGKTRDIELKGNRITIGRDPNNKISLNKSYISSRHAIITRNEDGEFLLEDCDSRNGTFLNKEKIEGGDHLVSVGDVIKIGYVEFKVVERPSSNAIPVIPLSERKKSSSGEITTP